MTIRTAGAALVGATLLGCAPPVSQAPPKNVIVVGVDVSGSFRAAHYQDATNFAAYYLYAHLNGLGSLRKPSALFTNTGRVRAAERRPFATISHTRSGVRSSRWTETRG